MKGLIFTEFLEMVESRFGLETLDKVLYSGELKSDGVYTAVGTYDHAELVELVKRLGHITRTPEPELLRDFGIYLFGVFARNYSELFGRIRSSLDFFENIDRYIHVEVAKLYPDAELPRFSFDRVSENQIVMLYESERRMGDFAVGLMLGCAAYFNETITVQQEDLSNGDGSRIKFTVTRVS